MVTRLITITHYENRGHWGRLRGGGEKNDKTVAFKQYLTVATELKLDAIPWCTVPSHLTVTPPSRKLKP